MEKNKGLFSIRKHHVGNFSDRKKGRKRKGGRLCQGLAMLLAVALVGGTLPANGLTVSASGREAGLCKHHQEHDADCGYIPKSEDGEGSPCTYKCRICPVEDLIAALPDKVTEDNAEDVRAQLEEILVLYRELNEDEQEQIDLSRCYELQEALDNANAPMTVAEEINISQTPKNILTAEDGGCPGHTFTGKVQTAMIYVESGTHDVTFSNLTISQSAMVGIAPGATMNLTIEGTNTILASYNLAGIYVPVSATLIINGTGTLNVSGSSSAGIGGAAYVPDENGSDGNPNCGTVEIKGGTVTATGGSGCAGIGGGKTDYVPGNGGTVTISGGTVTATGDSSGYYGGAGIGGAGGVSNEWNKLVSGSGGTLTINGGTVNLTAGTHDPQYPAYGFGQGSGDASGGTCELTLADASYLDSGTTLDPNGKYTINGDPTADMIVVPEDLIYNGKAQELDGKIYIDDSKTGTGTYFEQTFTVKASAEGWELQDLGEVVGAGEYTATFKKGDKEISKTFTVAKSGTDLADGKIKTYNGSEETTSFSADDTITVKATPAATGTAPQKAAARLRGGYTAPTAGQMALFVGDVQVSEPVQAGEGGTYTMTVSAAEVLLQGNAEQNGNAVTLTAKFVGNDNMADAAGTVDVRISAVAMAERDGEVIGYFGVSNFEGTNNLFCKEAYADATITLLGDVKPGTNSDAGTTCSTMVNITCTLDLAGHNFTSTDTAIYVLPGGNLTIQDSSTGKTGNVSFIKSDGTLTLYGGTFGKIETAYTLASLLAENCAYYKGSTPILLSELEGQKTLDGTVTVQECQHKDVTPTANNDGTHTLSCPYCGYTKTAEDCDYGEYIHNDTSHTRICKLCGYQNVEAHNIKCTAEASGTVIAVSEACKTCGYGKDLGTVTIHIPKLVYGDLTGVVTAENTLTEPVAVAGNVKNPLGETIIFSDHAIIDPPTMATLTGNALLSAGEHKIKINIVIIRDENALAECELTFNVDPAPLTADMVTLSAESTTYSGTEQKPTVTVAGLTEGTDYAVRYTRDGVVTNDFTSAGTVKITVTGKGNYGGEVEKTFTIKQEESDVGTVTAETLENTLDVSQVVLSRTNQTLAGTLMLTDSTLKYGTNSYTWKFTPDNTNYKTVTGEVEVTVNDTASPTGEISIGTNKWNSFLNKITFGLFFKKTDQVTITAQDNESGVASVSYYISDSGLTEEEVKKLENWTAGNTDKTTISISQKESCVVYAKITDNQGNMIYISSDGLQFDGTLPSITGVTDGETYCTPQTVTVTDDNLETVTVNGKEQILSDGKFTLDVKFDTAAIVIAAEDKAGNVTTVTVNAGHSYGTEWKSDSDGHWQECAVCGDKSKVSAHTEDSGTVTKPATQTETGIRTYKCSVCGYEMRTEIIEKLSPSHKHSYGTEWKSDSNGHWHECGCGAKSDSGTHTEDGGTATKPATQTETGIRTYKCSVCGYKMRTEIIEKLPESHTHSYGTEWKSDSNNHWHECGCGAKSDNGTHTEDGGTVTKPATQTETGIRTYKCSVCGYKMRTEIIEKLPESHTHSYGTEWKSDSNNHWHECSCGDKSDSAAHTEDSGTVTKPATETETGIRTYKCSVCGYEMRTEIIEKLPESHTHSYGTEWKSDSNNHWHECSCGEKSGTAAHIENGGSVTKAPTETEKGVRTYKCSVCGYIMRTEEIGKLPPAPTETSNPTGPAKQPQETITPGEVRRNSSKLDSGIYMKWKGKKLVLKWTKIAGAGGYDIFAGQGGKKLSKKSLVKTVKNGKQSVSLTKIAGKKLSGKKMYSVQIKAWKNADGKKIYIGNSRTYHIAGRENRKYTNAKKLKLKKKKYVLKKSTSARIKVTVIRQSKKKKLPPKSCGPALQYWSDNEKIATVTQKGRVKAKTKGTCYIYVTALNGVRTKIKITVK